MSLSFFGRISLQAEHWLSKTFQLGLILIAMDLRIVSMSSFTISLLMVVEMENYHVVRNAGCARSRYTLTLSIIFEMR